MKGWVRGHKGEHGARCGRAEMVRMGGCSTAACLLAIPKAGCLPRPMQQHGDPPATCQAPAPPSPPSSTPPPHLHHEPQRLLQLRQDLDEVPVALQGNGQRHLVAAVAVGAPISTEELEGHALALPHSLKHLPAGAVACGGASRASGEGCMGGG